MSLKNSDLQSINFSTSSAIFRWQPTAWLRVTGDDAEGFLQGQFTNDLRGLEDGKNAVYGLWLDVKGKVLADSFVLRGANSQGGESGAEFWIGSYFSPATVIRARLESHIIADDVVIADETANWRGVSMLGQDALVALLAKRNLARDTSATAIFQGRRTRDGSGEWIFPTAMTEEVQKQLTGLPELNSTEIDRLRIRAGIPAVPMDLGPGDLPNEGALEADAISYTKGCYLGQEVMARLKSMGQVRRRLLAVRGATAEWPATPAPLFLGDRKVGELRSAVRDERDGFIGLAMLSLLHLPPNAELALAVGAAPTVFVEGQP